MSQPLDTGKPVDSGTVTPDHHDSGREAIAAQALDVISSRVAVLGADGTIVTVNRAWRNFAHRHDADACEGRNFFDICHAARGEAGTAARTVAAALRQVLDGTLPAYEGELQWPAEADTNWSGIQIFPLRSGGARMAVVMYDDITSRKNVESALRETEQAHQRAQEIARVVSWTADVSTSTFHPSIDAAHLLGWSHGPHNLDDVFALIHPQDRERHRTQWNRSIREGLPFESVHRLVLPDGIHWVRAKAEFIFSADGRQVRAFGVTHDITEERRVQAALKISERQRQFALDAARLGTWHHLSATGNVTLDRRARLLWDLDESEIPLSELLERVHPDDRSRLVGADAVGRPGRFTVEFRVRHRDGSAHWLLSHVQLSRNDDTATPSGFETHGTVQDISDFKRNEELITRLVSANPVVIYALDIVDGSFQVRWFSDNLQTMTGWTAEQSRGPSWWTDNIHPDDRPRVLAGRPASLERQHSIEEFRFRRADGTFFWVRNERRILSDADGRPSEVVGSWSDITERVALEEQLRQSHKLEAVGLLAGGIAHDFNNLLTVIGGNADLLAPLLDRRPQARGLLDEIRDAVVRATALTRQLLAFSRAQVLAPRVLLLNDLVLQVKELLVRLIGEDIRCECILDDTAGYVRVDSSQIEQVLVNLAVNARDAMPLGGRLTLRTSRATLGQAFTALHPDVPPGEYSVVSVTDTGTGMSRDVIARIFEPFFTTKEAGRGTGLGLPMAFGIVKQSGGHLQVESRVGEGSTFTVYLPRVEREAVPAAEPGPDASARHGHETILLVEDEDSVRKLARVALERSGYVVLTAPNGVAALEIVERHRAPIDLLLTDVVMPEMRGPDLANVLQQRRKGIKVLFMSGYVQDALDRSDVAESNFLLKPFSLKQLTEKVRAILDAL